MMKDLPHEAMLFLGQSEEVVPNRRLRKRPEMDDTLSDIALTRSNTESNVFIKKQQKVLFPTFKCPIGIHLADVVDVARISRISSEAI